MENLPTEFGPIDIRAQLTRADALTVTYRLRAEGPTPKRIVLHMPGGPAVRRLRVNGKTLTARGRAVILR